MIRIKQMLIFFGTISLLCITGIASTTDKKLCQTSQCIQPIQYNISLRIQNTSIIVNSTVVIKMSRPWPRMRLQIGRYCSLINEITVQPTILYTFPLRWNSTRLNFSYSSKHRFDSLDITLFKEERTHIEQLDKQKVVLKPGVYKIHSQYNCTLEEVATVFSTYRNQSETKEFLILPRIPNEWIFPYWENPTTKARFTIQIQHKITDIALSNMPETFASSLRNTVFSTSPPISTHLVAVGVIPNVHTLTDKPVIIRSRFSAQNDTSYAQILIRNIIKRIRKKWNDIIPRSHVYYVLLPINSTYYESIVTPGFVFLSEAKSIYNREADSIVKEREVTCFIARNVIQEMFTDWLATFRVSDSWFIEGFLTVYGVYIHDQSLIKSIVVQTRRNYLDYIEVFNDSKYDFPIQEKPFITRNSPLRKLWREKAFSTFYMLNILFEQDEDLLYTSMFKQAINVYYNTKNTSNYLPILDQLWYWNFEALLLKSKYPLLDNIRNLITSWTAWIGYPVLQVKRQYSGTAIVLSVIDCCNVDYKQYCKQKWWIHVIMNEIQNTTVSNIFHFLLEPDEEYGRPSLLNKNEFVIIANSAGYRVNYDRESWKLIAFFLKNVDPKIAFLSDVTLAQLLDDAFYFLVQNTEYNEDSAPDESDLDIYLDLASSLFHVNNSYATWYPVLFALENMSNMFPFPESDLSKPIKDTLLAILNRFLDDMSYTNSLEFNVSNQLYHEVLKWTCILDSSKCKTHVNGILEWHFKHPAQNKLLRSWQKWIYCQGLMLEVLSYEESALWQTIFNIYRTQGRKEEFFEFVPCSRHCSDKNLYSFLRSLDSNSLPTPGRSLNAKESVSGNIVNAKKSVTVTLLFDMFALHSKNNSALNTIVYGLGNGIGRDVNMLAIINCIINNIYSDEGLSKISEASFLQYLTFINLWKPFVLDAIKKKIENRRSFLVNTQNAIFYKPQYIFNYKYLSKEIFFL